MKNPKVRTHVRPPPARAGIQPTLHPGHRVFRTQVQEGDVITFDPTGEQLRVSKIEDGRITFEKLP